MQTNRLKKYNKLADFYDIFAKRSQLDVCKPTRLPPYCLLIMSLQKTSRKMASIAMIAAIRSRTLTSPWACPTLDRSTSARHVDRSTVGRAGALHKKIFGYIEQKQHISYYLHLQLYINYLFSHFTQQQQQQQQQLTTTMQYKHK